MKQQENKLDTELYRCIKELDITKLSEDDRIELLNFFRITNNPLIRNHIALIFSDLQYNEAVPDIIEKIMDEKTANDRGTLVFSLENLDCKKYFLSLIKVIGEMDYESRLMAYGIVQKLKKSLPPIMKTQAIEQLEKYRVHLEKTSKDRGENSSLHFVEKTKELLEE